LAAIGCQPTASIADLAAVRSRRLACRRLAHCTAIGRRASTLLGVPGCAAVPPPQSSGAVHMPHWTSSPHPFRRPAVPRRTAGFGGRASPPSPCAVPAPQVLGPPPPQKAGALHPPQSMTLPHPSPCLPQPAPRSAHVFGVQAVPLAIAPHLLKPPPPQKSGAVHAPQSMTLPQPSP